jgi:non-ribosomal peptide synthetase component E (peptide arylation enzyme)
VRYPYAQLNAAVDDLAAGLIDAGLTGRSARRVEPVCAHFKVPRHVLFVDEFPMTAVGVTRGEAESPHVERWSARRALLAHSRHG